MDGMDVLNWVFLLVMVAVWLAGFAVLAAFGIHLSHIEKHSAGLGGTLGVPPVPD